jgi:hypothetical protein
MPRVAVFSAPLPSPHLVTTTQEARNGFMRVFSSKLITLATLLLGTCWGCGPGSRALPSLLPVKGSVTYKGQPVTKGVIRFEPDDYGRPATGQLQSDGTFVLSTLKEGDGVVAGHHRIAISDLEKSLAKNRALRKYGSPNTSGLTADVSQEKTEFTFDLK